VEGRCRRRRAAITRGRGKGWGYRPFASTGTFARQSRETRHRVLLCLAGSSSLQPHSGTATWASWTGGCPSLPNFQTGHLPQRCAGCDLPPYISPPLLCYITTKDACSTLAVSERPWNCPSPNFVFIIKSTPKHLPAGQTATVAAARQSRRVLQKVISLHNKATLPGPYRSRISRRTQFNSRCAARPQG